MVSRFPGEGRGGAGDDLVGLLDEGVGSQVSPQELQTCVPTSPCLLVPPDRFVVTAATRFRKIWMEKNLRETYRLAARAIFELEPRIDFELVGSPSPPPVGPQAGIVEAAP